MGSSTDMPDSLRAVRTDEIRQIQMLMVLCSCLPKDGKLAQVIRMALDLDHKPLHARVRPVTDVSLVGLGFWLEELWGAAGGTNISKEEQSLIRFQHDPSDQAQENSNMVEALKELIRAEHQLGFKLCAQKLS